MAIGKRLALKQPHFGYLIRELRQEMGLTQEQFAAELGVVYPQSTAGKMAPLNPHQWR